MINQHLFMALLSATILTASCHVCDDPVEITTGTCAKILKNLEKALLGDEGNLFRLRRAFFHSPTADPVLLKVAYNITYAENITTAFAGGKIQPCSASAANSSIEFWQQNITLGWTSTGVYTVFHPTVLNMMQTQLPFSILRAVHKLDMHQFSPTADTFLWDGSYDLPTLHLNMHIASLPCTPSQDLFESVLMDLNTMLKVYTDQQAVRRSFENNIGFTTPSQMVSSTINLSRQRAEVIIVNIYSFFMCFFYAVGVYAFLKYFYPSYKNQISAYVSNHKELVGGLTVTTALSVATEILTRIINSAVWSASLDNFSGALVAVLLPQGFIFFMGTCVNICCHIIYLKKPQASNSTENKPAIQLRIQRTCTIEQAPAGDSKQTTENQAPAGDSKETTDKQGTVSVPKQNAEKRDSKRTGEIEVINLASDREEAEHETINLINDPLATESNNNRGNLGFFIGHCDAIATRFSHDINVHIILPLTLTAYGIIYTAFPTFVLMVAYPTQVIMIVPTAIALLFATIIFSAIMFKLLNYKLSKLLTRPEKIVNTIKFVVCRYIPFYVAVLLLKSVAVIFLYLLIIARGSIGTGLLLTLILSILPTALISGISWIAKKSLLDKKKKESSEESGNQPPRAAERQSSNQ